MKKRGRDVPNIVELDNHKTVDIANAFVNMLPKVSFFSSVSAPHGQLSDSRHRINDMSSK
jgi:hypothetical protein